MIDKPFHILSFYLLGLRLMLKATFILKNALNLLMLVLITLPTPSKATELLMLTDDGPPHMIAATNSGIDIDITREVLESMGHTIKIKFAPLKRTMKQVINQKADLFLPTFFQNDTPNIFISAAIISYRPVVFSLKKNNFTLKNIKDLSGKKLVTFQGAAGYFGDEFVKVSKHKNYRELHDMSKFPEMLMKQRCDVVVLDYYIFYYYLKEYIKQNPATEFTVKDVDEFLFFPEVEAHVGFNDKKLRNRFNEQLKIYKKQGKDTAVINKYLTISPEDEIVK
ncbi:MAG: transporter substrate-binding domain-containing protein [Colwellia sp.]|nr:transporter substrate-binding domain-containing protein [Colwellia sp.]